MLNQLLSFFIIFVSLVNCTSSLSEVDQACVNRPANRVLLDNNKLLGQWYVLIHFNPGFSFKMDTCKALNYTRPSQDDILRYKAKYTNQTAPYNLDDNPVLVTDGSGLINGMIMGHKRAKFYVTDPSSNIVVSEGYSAVVYRPINEKFLLFYKCSFQREIIDLFSREKCPDEVELEVAVAKVRNLKNMERQRFCAPKIVESYEIEL